MTTTFWKRIDGKLTCVEGTPRKWQKVSIRKCKPPCDAKYGIKWAPSLVDGKRTTSHVQAVWFTPEKARTKREADAWLKRNGFPPSMKIDRQEGYFRARLHDPKKFKCFRLGPWVDGGRMRFLFAGNLPPSTRW